MEIKALRRQGKEGGVSVPSLPEGCPPLSLSLFFFAVSIQPRFPDATKAAVAAIIKKWLYSAGDREGGRTTRRQLDGANSDE